MRIRNDLRSAVLMTRAGLLMALLLVPSCAKSAWTADEVVGEFRAYGLPTRDAREPSPGDCPVGGARPRNVRRFGGDTVSAAGWACILQFDDASTALKARTELRGNNGTGSASQRDNIVLLLSADFDGASAAAYRNALQRMWGGE